MSEDNLTPDPITPSETPVSEENPISPDTTESILATTLELSTMPPLAQKASRANVSIPLAKHHN